MQAVAHAEPRVHAKRQPWVLVGSKRARRVGIEYGGTRATKYVLTLSSRLVNEVPVVVHVERRQVALRRGIGKRRQRPLGTLAVGMARYSCAPHNGAGTARLCARRNRLCHLQQMRISHVQWPDARAVAEHKQRAFTLVGVVESREPRALVALGDAAPIASQISWADPLLRRQRQPVVAHRRQQDTTMHMIGAYALWQEAVRDAHAAAVCACGRQQHDKREEETLLHTVAHEEDAPAGEPAAERAHVDAPQKLA